MQPEPRFGQIRVTFTDRPVCNAAAETPKIGNFILGASKTAQMEKQKYKTSIHSRYRPKHKNENSQNADSGKSWLGPMFKETKFQIF